MRARSGGFTLIELLIASALLAVLAVLSWRGLDTVLTARERLVANSNELGALNVAFSQLDEDLRRAWPVSLLGNSQRPLRPIEFARINQTPSLTIELLRETTTPADPVRVQQVVYRLNGTVLERGFAPWRPPPADADPTQPGFYAPMVWQPLLGNVAHIELRAWLETRGWTPTAVLAKQRDPSGTIRNGPQVLTNVPITGIELAITRTDGQRLLRIFAVAD